MENQLMNNTTDSDRSKIRLKIKDQKNLKPVVIKVYKDSTFGKVFRAYQDKMGITSNRYKYHYDDCEIDSTQSVEDVLGADLEDTTLLNEGFTIHAQMAQLGGN